MMHSTPIPIPTPRRAWPVGLAALLAGGLATGCRPAASTPTAAHAPELVPVAAVTVTNAAWDRTVAIVGTLFPKDEATVAARVEGQIEATLVDFGDRVREGQEIAAIDTTAYVALLEQASGNRAKAEANLANAKPNFERVQKLRQSGIAADSDLDVARSQLDQWDAEVKAAAGAEAVARLNLDRSKVKAPFDGAVAQRVVGRGDFVKIGSPLFTLVNDAVLKFIFQVPERHASMVTKRLPVTFSVDNYPGEMFRGSVYLISPAVSTGSRAFSVGALVTNTNFRLKASTFARGELVLEQGVPTPVVPVEAVVSFAGVTRVFVLEGTTARSRQVVTGRIRDGLQEIREGLAVGDRVIVSGQAKVTDGLPVALRDATPGRAGPPGAEKPSGQRAAALPPAAPASASASASASAAATATTTPLASSHEAR